MIATLFLFCAALFCTAAQATTFEESIDLKIDQSAPGAGYASTYEAVERWNLLEGVPVGDHEIASSWGPLTCHVKGGRAYVEFRAVKSSWPTTWPSSATCEDDLDGHTFKLTINMTSCGTARTCARFDPPETIPNCPGTNTLSLALATSGTRYGVCWLDTPPTGKTYAAPPNARPAFPGSTERVYPALWQRGASKSETDDAPSTAAQCGIRAFVENGTTTKYLLTYHVSPTVKGTRWYCPIQLVDNSSGAFTWDDRFTLSVTRAD